MSHRFRHVFAALALLFIGLAPLPARAAMVPAGIATTTQDATALPTSEVRWGRGGGRGFRGGWHRGGPRFHRGWHRPRVHYRPYRVRPVYYGRPVTYGYGPRCIRRGWVWNGWRHVWRRYRVC